MSNIIPFSVTVVTADLDYYNPRSYSLALFLLFSRPRSFNSVDRQAACRNAKSATNGLACVSRSIYTQIVMRVC